MESHNPGPECVILIGLPGAGKSTFVRQHYPRHVHVSKDNFPPGARNKQARQDELLRGALAAGRPVVVDNTNVTVADRASIIGIARDFGARIVGVYMDVAVRDAIARNETRQGRARVPKVAIFTAAKRLEPPTSDEGFDELRVER